MASVLLLAACAAHTQEAPADAADPDKPAAEKVALPGITIDAKQKRVDLAATVALDEGLLELVACTKDSKEHESLVVIEAAPVHLHAALLLIGANNGHPAMTKPANEEKTQWDHLPPKGDRIAVSLVYADPADPDKTIERPISDFLKRSDEGEGKPADDVAKVFDVFLFAGSLVVNTEDGQRQYLADESGNVVSISTFGDEVVCLPMQVSQENAALIWAVNDQHLPKVGTKVTLRLTLKEKVKEQGEE